MTLNLFIGSSIKAYKFQNNQFRLGRYTENKVRHIKIIFCHKIGQIKVIENLSYLKRALEDFNRVSVCINRNQDEGKVIK